MDGGIRAEGAARKAFAGGAAVGQHLTAGGDERQERAEREERGGVAAFEETANRGAGESGKMEWRFHDLVALVSFSFLNFCLHYVLRDKPCRLPDKPEKF